MRSGLVQFSAKGGSNDKTGPDVPPSFVTWDRAITEDEGLQDGISGFQDDRTKRFRASDPQWRIGDQRPLTKKALPMAGSGFRGRKTRQPSCFPDPPRRFHDANV